MNRWFEHKSEGNSFGTPETRECLFDYQHDHSEFFPISLVNLVKFAHLSLIIFILSIYILLIEVLYATNYRLGF